MAALREILVAFDIKIDTKPIDEGNKKADGFKANLQKLAGAVASYFAVDKIQDFVLSTIAAGDAIGDQAARLNMSSHSLEQWTYAAKFADIQAGELDGIFNKLARTSVEAGDATSDQAKVLKQLGVDVKDANGHFKDTGTLFEEVGLGLAGMKDETQRTALSFQFFGKTAGPKVLQIFKDGPEGIKKFRAEFEALGGGMGDFVEQAGAIDDQFHRLDLAWTSAKVKIVGLLAPAISWVTDKLVGFLSAANNAANSSNIVKAALITLGGVAVAWGFSIAAAWAPLILTTAAWAAALAAVALVLDDVITFFQGGDSVIGRAIDAWFGEGSSAKVREWGIALAGAIGPILSGALKGALDIVKSAVDLVRLAFADSTTEADKFRTAFEKDSQSIVDAIDAILNKLAALKDLLPTSWSDAADTFRKGANSALDVAESGVSAVLGTETRIERDARGGAARPGSGGPLTPDSIRQAFLPNQTATAQPVPAWFGATPPAVAPISVGSVTVNAGSNDPARAAGKAVEDKIRKATAPNRAAAAAFDRRGK
jgi:hypothetical protein